MEGLAALPSLDTLSTTSQSAELQSLGSQNAELPIQALQEIFADTFEADTDSSPHTIDTIPTFTSIPQEIRDVIFSCLLPDRDFETCSSNLCTPRMLLDDDILRNGRSFSIRGVNRDLYTQCFQYLLKHRKVYIDPDLFLIPIRAHIDRPATDITPSFDVIPLIRNIFITDRHLALFTQFSSLSRLTGVRTIQIEHNMTQTPFDRVQDVRDIIGPDNLELSEREDIKFQLMRLSIRELSALHGRVWSQEEEGFLGLRVLLAHGLGISDACGLSITVCVRCPKCQCAECRWVRADPEGHDTTVTIVYDWDSQIVLDTFWV